ncbi:MAG: hypothetical protein V3T41_07035 [bacterium]
MTAVTIKIMTAPSDDELALFHELFLEYAASLGYERMRLDTVPAMKEAASLYRAMGFRETDPYCENPIEGATYMEVTL